MPRPVPSSSLGSHFELMLILTPPLLAGSNLLQYPRMYLQADMQWLCCLYNAVLWPLQSCLACALPKA